MGSLFVSSQIRRDGQWQKRQEPKDEAEGRPCGLASFLFLGNPETHEAPVSRAYQPCRDDKSGPLAIRHGAAVYQNGAA